MAEAPKPVSRPEPPLKQDPAARLPDPARSVADPAAPGKTNPGPGANQDQPALAPMQTSPAAPAFQRNAPNQPVVPAPSEHIVPGPVGRPDPSRAPEERQMVADAAVEAHNQRPGHLLSNESPRERTSDGKPDRSSVPQPTE